MERIPTEAAAYEYLESLRWDGEPVCPHCGNGERCYFLNPANGTDRKTRTGALSERRVWKCGACRKQFSVLTGSVMHGTRIAVRTWVLVLLEMCSAKNGISAREIERRYGVTNRSAWFMLHRIRHAMDHNGMGDLFYGTVTADETFIGGKAKNRKRHGRPTRQKSYGKGSRGGTGSGPAYGKTAVLTLIENETGRSRSRVVNDVTAPTLRKAIEDQVIVRDSTLLTDAHMSYRKLGEEAALHLWVDHSRNQYVRREARGVVSTNPCENFFSQLKRSLDGTHHHVSTVHLARYLAEYDFRYSTRDESDGQRFQRLVNQTAGIRLAYKSAATIPGRPLVTDRQPV